MKRSGKSKTAKTRAGVVANRLPAKPSDAPVKAVFLVGFMGAGKSSVGRALGHRLNWIFEDLDDRIEQRQGRRIPEIFRDFGEAEFRRIEHAALRDLLSESPTSGRIVALGGGAFVQSKNARLLTASALPTVFLDAPVEELWERCLRQAEQVSAERPLRGSPRQFRTLYQARRKGYSKASMMISTSHREIDNIAAEIVETLGLIPIELRIEEGEVE